MGERPAAARRSSKGCALLAPPNPPHPPWPHRARREPPTPKGKDAIAFLESLVVGDVAGLADGTGSLSVFTNEKGGIIDDTVITKAGRAGWGGGGGASDSRAQACRAISRGGERTRCPARC